MASEEQSAGRRVGEGAPRAILRAARAPPPPDRSRRRAVCAYVCACACVAWIPGRPLPADPLRPPQHAKGSRGACATHNTPALCPRRTRSRLAVCIDCRRGRRHAAALIAPAATRPHSSLPPPCRRRAPCPPLHACPLQIHNLGPGRPTWLDWDCEGSSLAIMQEGVGIYLWDVAKEGPAGAGGKPTQPLRLAPSITNATSFCMWSRKFLQLAIGTNAGKVCPPLHTSLGYHGDTPCRPRLDMTPLSARHGHMLRRLRRPLSPRVVSWPGAGLER